MAFSASWAGGPSRGGCRGLGLQGFTLALEKQDLLKSLTKRLNPSSFPALPSPGQRPAWSQHLILAQHWAGTASLQALLCLGGQGPDPHPPTSIQ